MRRVIKASACVVLLVGSVGLAGSPIAAGGPQRPFGDIQVFATLPYPGNPGGLAVDGTTLWVDTSSANLDRQFDGSDDIFAYDLRTGQQVRSPIVVPRTPLPAQLMGLAGIALDSAGRMYVADMNGRIDRVDPATGSSAVYATIPTSTYTTTPDMPVFLAFTADGNLYVGDAGGSPIIWRVPPGGGAAQAWYVDPRLTGGDAGSVLGVAVDPTGRYLYFAAGSQQSTIAVYRLPFASPDATHLEVVHRYADAVVNPCTPDVPAVLACAVNPLFGAGNIAFGQSGRLYVVLLAKDQVSILAPDGTEENRFPSVEANAQLPVPLNTPFDVTFDGHGSILVSNVGNPTVGYQPGHLPPPGGLQTSPDWVVYDIWVNDTAVPLVRPTIP